MRKWKTLHKLAPCASLGLRNMSKLKVCANKQELGNVAGKVIVETAKQAISQRDRFVVAFSGGSLPSIVAPYLIAQQKSVDWSKWFIVFSDERVVQDGHDDLNLVACKKAFLDQVPIPAENVIGIDVSGGLDDVDEVAQRLVLLRSPTLLCSCRPLT